ncbi:MAG: aldehyde dehydrogenase family protein [Bacteriovoracaceae bacterium]|nr:aldehyde dehydrogenase family protein [Bacteriovoracaceae bacterium]
MILLEQILDSLNCSIKHIEGTDLPVYSPIDGKQMASLRKDTKLEILNKITHAEEAFKEWRLVPAPKRGEFVRIFGEQLRLHKEELGRLVTLESGKIYSEGLGEVQEMIDICDYAVGLSRSIAGKTLPSERYGHIMQENWHPLGVVGVISAFNFPVAVWAWNAAISWVCGNSVVWKPSEKTPLTALACQSIFETALAKFIKTTEIEISSDLSSVIIGARKEGELLVNDKRIPLISATGSCRMGREIKKMMAEDLGRNALLELGGNNAIIITENADLDVALPSIVFGAVGTCGQRCTSTRRVIVHRSLFELTLTKIKKAYESLINSKKIGNPLSKEILIGPLIDADSIAIFKDSIAKAKQQGGTVYYGESINIVNLEGGKYVTPALVDMSKVGQTDIVKRETFGPILYVMTYEKLEQALELQNSVDQGLSSSIMTSNIAEAQKFILDSDCGIANVNIGTSGAEIGGAFGGNKDTGGGRESGSDSWKQYMRRSTNTIYYGTEKPELAQGVQFS